MKSQQEFMEGLNDLIKIGKTNGNLLTKEEVQDFFEEYNLNDTQMSLVGSFMEENQIKIEGVEAAAPVEEEEVIASEEEPSAVLSMYKEEIKELSKAEKEEEEKLLKAYLEGSAEAVNQLVEINLAEVISLAEKYIGQGVPQNDLIQEGNLALFLAVTEYEGPADGDAFHSHLMEAAEAAMVAYIGENKESGRMARKVANQANRLNDLATEYAKEHEREAKPEELAELMHITVEEVKDLMKMSLDAVNVLESRNINQ